MRRQVCVGPSSKDGQFMFLPRFFLIFKLFGGKMKLQRDNVQKRKYFWGNKSSLKCHSMPATTSSDGLISLSIIHCLWIWKSKNSLYCTVILEQRPWVQNLLVMFEAIETLFLFDLVHRALSMLYTYSSWKMVFCPRKCVIHWRTVQTLRLYIIRDYH